VLQTLSRHQPSCSMATPFLLAGSKLTSGAYLMNLAVGRLAARIAASIDPPAQGRAPCISIAATNCCASCAKTEGAHWRTQGFRHNGTLISMPLATRRGRCFRSWNYIGDVRRNLADVSRHVYICFTFAELRSIVTLNAPRSSRQCSNMAVA
jgi:hypothetical protein